MIRFRPAPDLADSRYVFFFTQSTAYKAWVTSRKRVAGQPNVNGAEYSALQFPLPPLREQRRIVELLEQADGLRRQRSEADGLADRILPALFHKIFGDPATIQKVFVPVGSAILQSSIQTALWFQSKVRPLCRQRCPRSALAEHRNW